MAVRESSVQYSISLAGYEELIKSIETIKEKVDALNASLRETSRLMKEVGGQTQSA